MTDADLRRAVAVARRFEEELLRRSAAGDVDCSAPAIPLAFGNGELLALRIAIAQLAVFVDEQLALAERGPSRQELLAVSCAADAAAQHARDAAEQLERITGKLWLKPAAASETASGAAEVVR